MFACADPPPQLAPAGPPVPAKVVSLEGFGGVPRGAWSAWALSPPWAGVAISPGSALFPPPGDSEAPSNEG